MTEAVSTDQLPVKLGQEYRVKLGKSFTFPRENAFHSIKYDFKPLSVDPTKSGNLRVSEDEVNVLLPLAESTDDMAQFRGPRKPVAKECVLIIDTVSGEAVLERISNSIQLKAIRDGRKPTNPRDRSVSPAPSNTSQSKATPTIRPTPPTTASTTSSTTKKRPIKSKTPKPSVKPESQPQSNPQSTTKKGSKKSIKKATAIKTEIQLPLQSTTSGGVTHPMASTVPSMPTFSQTSGQPVDTTVSGPGSHPTADHPLPTPSKKIKVDNSSSSSDSSSSDSSDSESENESNKPSQFSNSPLPPLVQSGHMPPMGGHMTLSSGHGTQPRGHTTQFGNQHGHMTQSGQVIGHLPQQRPPSTSSSSSDTSDSSSGSSSSDSSDSSDQENDREVASAFSQQQQHNNMRPRTMSQLRTDLQLSDSGSDSDS